MNKPAPIPSDPWVQTCRRGGAHGRITVEGGAPHHLMLAQDPERGDGRRSHRCGPLLGQTKEDL
jgi:hypothetical protein